MKMFSMIADWKMFTSLYNSELNKICTYVQNFSSWEIELIRE